VARIFFYSFGLKEEERSLKPIEHYITVASTRK